MTSDAPAASLFGSAPPKPVMTLRVGVSGHRPKPDVFPAAHFAFVQKRLRDVFGAIDGDLIGIAQASTALYAEAAPKVRLVSGLAEGADQMAVKAMPAGWTLDAILPLPADNYELDFKASALDGQTDVTDAFRQSFGRAETKLALPDDLAPQARDAAYVRLGGFLLRQVDLLVAVWDGQPEQGRGGTGEVVRAALAADIPVVWISAVEDVYARMVESVERDGRVEAPEADCLQGPLTEAIQSIVLLPEAGEGEEDAEEAVAGADAPTRLQDFLRERWPQPSRWVAYDLFKRAMEGKAPRWLIAPESPAEYGARWARSAGDGPTVGALKERLTDILSPRFAWADALAVEYSHRYRSAYILTYLLAAFAVLIALGGIFHGGANTNDEVLAHKAILVFIEALCLFRILRLVQRGRSERWKEKWMEFRALAELLINARFLAYLGEHGRTHRLGNFEAAPSSWFLWYLRATIREIGLPSAELDGAYQRAVLGAVDKHVIGEQTRWHIANFRALNAMNRILHTLGRACFVATFCLLVGFLLSSLAYVVSAFVPGAQASREAFVAFMVANKDWVTLFAALLPAVGAALAGVRETGDFGKVAEHSAKTAAALNALHREIARAKRELTLEETGDVLLSTAQVLSADLAAWQAVYGHKRLELPA